MKKILSLLLVFVILFSSSSMSLPINAKQQDTVSNKIKIACVGDSITFGDKTSDIVRYSYPSQIQNLLGNGYEVQNYGLNGQTMTKSSWCDKYLNTSAGLDSRNFLPDVVIIMLGTNDSQDICWESSNGKNTYEESARELIKSYQNLSSAPEVYIATCPTADDSNQFGIKSSVINEEIIPLQKKVAEELGCKVIEINELTKNYASDGLITQSYNGKPDMVHPNDDGYYMLSKFMYNGIASDLGLSELDTSTIELDCFNSRIQYDGTWGNWKENVIPPLYMGTEKFTELPGSAATLEFRGTGIQVTGIRTSQLTLMDVYLDGTIYQTSDTNIPSGSMRHEPLFSIDSLPYGDHTIKVVLSNVKEAHHMYGTKISLDSFRIFQEPQGFVDTITFQSESGDFIMEGKKDTLQISTQIMPDTAENKVVQYSIEPKGSASITKDGLITSHIEDGSFWVKAVAKDESLRTVKQEIKVIGSKDYELIDDRNPLVAYTGSWADKATSNAYNQTIKETHAQGDTAVLEFNGTGISIIGQLNHLGNFSYAEVEIDGTRAGVASFIHNMDGVGSIDREVLFEITDLKPGIHTIKLTARPNASSPETPSSNSCGLTLDGFKVYNTTKTLNKKVLNDTLYNAKVTCQNAVIGNEAGNYPEKAIKTLQDQMDLANTIFTNSKLQSEIDNAATALKEAIKTFSDSIIGNAIIHTVEVQKPEHGNIQVLDSSGSQLQDGKAVNGQEITVEIIPDEKYRADTVMIGGIKKKLGTDTDKSASIQITVNQNLKISSTLKKIKIKVACIGDSITFGACSTDPASCSYPARLQKLLGDDYEVQNFGMSSATLKYNGSFPYVDQSVYLRSLKYQPDMVIIMLGTNDGTQSNWSNGYGREEFKKDAAKLVGSYKNLDSNPDIYMATAPYTYMDSRQSIINNHVVPATKEAAKELGCGLIDMNQQTFELSKYFFYGDLLHFNDNGYKYLAQVMLEGLNIEGVDQRINKTDLYKLYYPYKDLKPTDCVTTSWPVFEHARAEAKRLIESPQSKQSEIIVVARKLQEALALIQFNNPVKIACVGDSITYGHNADPRNSMSYPAQLQAMLGSKYNVQNFGVNGRTMNDQVNDRYISVGEYAASKNFNPDKVIIMLGTNDSKNKNWIDEDEYTQSAKRLIDSYKALSSNPVIYIATAPAVEEDMSSSTDPEADIIRNNRIRENIVPLQKKIAAENRCQIIDVNKMTVELENFSDYMSTDRIHPHNGGYTLLANTMFKSLVPNVPALTAELQEELNIVNEIALSNYTKNTVDALNTVIEHVKAILADTSLTIDDQEYVDDVKAQLELASQNLLLKGNKEKLQSAVSKAQSISLSGYTKESADKFQAALSRAKALLADENLSIKDQKMLDDASTVLTQAQNALVREQPAPVIKVSKITLKPASKKLILGKNVKISTSILPENAANKGLKWSTSNNKTAVVTDKGVITAKGAGTATITAVSADGGQKKATVKITVVPKTISINKIKKASGNSAVVSWKKDPKISGYEIQVSTKSKSGFKTKAKVKAGKSSVTIKKLAKGKKNYFRMRTYKKVGKITYKGEWSKVASIKIK